MQSEYVAAAITSGGAILFGVFSFVLKQILRNIEIIDTRIQSIEQAAFARIDSVEKVIDAKIRENESANIGRQDRILAMLVENSKESDRKFATVREIISVQDRLQAIDSNIRAILSALNNLVNCEK